MQQASISTSDLIIHGAWREGTPTQRQQPLHKEAQLLPRIADYYERLKSLPRRVRRSLQRKCKRSLAGVAVLLALGAQPAMAATINMGGQCTLARAIVSANNDRSPQGFCRPGSSADMIVLPRNSTQTLTQANNTNYGPTGLPTIRTQITIVGNGSRIQRVNTAPRFRIFSVAKTGKLTLQKTTVRGGAVQKANIGVGGINNRGVLNLVGSTVSGNQGCGVASGGEDMYDGETFVDRVTVNKTTISGNIGCGIAADYSDGVVVTNSIVSNNGTDGIGAFNGRARVVNSTVSGNDGSGIALVEGGAIVINSTITGNAGTESFKGYVAGKLGGGVYVGNYSGATITNSTISGNTADLGGGLYSYYGGYPEITNSTITGNAAGQGGGIWSESDDLTLRRTIVAGNQSLDGRELFASEIQGADITAGNFNIFGYNESSGLVGFIPETTDIVPTQPLGAILKPTLALNGGPTQTHALVAGSVAIDAVNNGTCPPPATDQRGIKRPRDGNGDGGLACDIASFER